MKYISIALILIATSFSDKGDDRKTNFPVARQQVSELPEKENLWIFILAGQSNMAGRGFVEPADTLPNARIFALGEDKEWLFAKEPLHFYEPELTGLDCGLSFANELLKHVPENISIGLVPCAVGGSSIAQWNNDETHRGVTLFTNLKERVESVHGQGVIKGVLWHQGESDAHPDQIPHYRGETEQLFSKFRKLAGNDSLPILVGELGAFMQPKENQLRCDAINTIIRESARSDEFRFVISTSDFTHKGDHLHFNSKSQREMGVRFAMAYAEHILQ